ncbi:MAG: pyridoxal 5'-phosphate synthase glutaminase subunit PdxT [Chloroflexi bacterium]|nr:pyridoxal 5'-phosphate synthase glutaminase subunit PdxT [Chloroflexota bacterium]
MKVGVLALQGDFLEHVLVLNHMGLETREVRLPQDLEGLQGLVIPGGESTTMARLMDSEGLREAICRRAQQGMVVWGSCAGLILVASKLREDRPTPLGLMDIRVARNAFGRQIDSFEVDLTISVLGEQPFRAIFIRAPVILEVGKGVVVLARLSDGTPVAARQGGVIVTAFHPELTDDTRFHDYFLAMAEGTN